MTKKIYKLINIFLNEISINKIELYNEFNFQFELAYYLRINGYKVDFERNVSYFGLEKNNFIKKEIDLVVYEGETKIAIELKFPNNGQVPEQMFSFIKDIKFLEQLKYSGKFNGGIFVILTNNHCFWEGNDTINELYYSYRNNFSLEGLYKKPTGKKDASIELKNKYIINWNNLGIDNIKFFINNI